MKKLVIDPTPLKFETGECLVQLHYKQINYSPSELIKKLSKSGRAYFSHLLHVVLPHAMPFIKNAFFSTKNSKNTCCLRRCSILNALNLAKWGVKIQNCAHFLDFLASSSQHSSGYFSITSLIGLISLISILRWSGNVLSINRLINAAFLRLLFRLYCLCNSSTWANTVKLSSPWLKFGM